MPAAAAGNESPVFAADLGQRRHWARLQRLMDPERRAREAALGLDACPILAEQRHEPPGRGDRAVRGLADALQEEAQPGLPVPVASARDRAAGSTRRGAA